MNTHDKYELPPLPDWADRTLQGEDRDSLFAWASAAIEADRKRQGDAAKVVAELVEIIPLSDTLKASASCKDLIDYFKGVTADRQRRGEPVAFAKDGALFWHGEHKHGVSCDLYAAPQPAEPTTDSLPRHVAQTLADAIYKAAQKMGIANGDHSTLSVPQCLHLLACMSQPAEPTIRNPLTVAEPVKPALPEGWTWTEDGKAKPPPGFIAEAQSVEPVKGPSDDEIVELRTAYDWRTPQGNIRFARALLARYGQPAPQDGEYEACPMQYVEKTEPRDDDWAVAAKDGMMVHGGLQREDALLIAAALNAYGQPAQPAALCRAAREVLDTELGELACTGSDAPAEHALGLLADAVVAQPAASAEPCGICGGIGSVIVGIDGGSPRTKACPRCAAQLDSDEDAYVIERMSKLLAEIAVIVRGPELPRHRHGYADLPARVAALKASTVAAQPSVPGHLMERLRAHSEDKSNTAFARSAMKEALQYMSSPLVDGQP